LEAQIEKLKKALVYKQHKSKNQNRELCEENTNPKIKVGTCAKTKRV
jgi:hypothetical protein